MPRWLRRDGNEIVGVEISSHSTQQNLTVQRNVDNKPVTIDLWRWLPLTAAHDEGTRSNEMFKKSSGEVVAGNKFVLIKALKDYFMFIFLRVLIVYPQKSK